MILRLLKGRGMVSGLFEKKQDAIPPRPTPPQALFILTYSFYYFLFLILVAVVGIEPGAF
jgi:uncharacterized membrane protein